ncbi:hypothetical protein LZ554_003003 [Drepanopeziza brunnea f. sp. 'monogermtubi']|nr:hypothetical protein LZ554_003003 [Drepanopeziza brunnea f. sp. 'monogermtubi']
MRFRNKNTTTYNDGTTEAKPSLLQRLLRLFQFLSAFTSLILFSVRLAKIVRLTKRATHSNGAVEGILAAAVLYTLVAMALTCVIKGNGSNMLRMLFIVLDVLFVGGFIAIAVLTSPGRHGSSGPCTPLYWTFSQGHAWRHPSKVNCDLPWGTFFLAILSTLLHAATAVYHIVKDRRRARKNTGVVGKEVPRNNGVQAAGVHNTGATRANGDSYDHRHV